MKANSVRALLVGLLLFSSQSLVYGQDDDEIVEENPNVYEEDDDDGGDEEDADAWDDDEEFDLDNDDGGEEDATQRDPWDNTDPDAKPMEDALPESLFAAIHLSSSDIPAGVLEFIQYELPHYPQLAVRDVGQSPAFLRIFEKEEHLKAHTLSEALENGAVPEEQLEELQSIPLPPREVIQQLAIESIDVSEHSAEEIRGVLADFNVLRKEKMATDDDDLDLTDDDDEVVFGEDGELREDGKVKKKKERVDWRARREERLKKKHAQKKGEKQNGFNPSYKISDGIGLGLPLPLLYLICIAGIGGSAYLGYLLYNTLQENQKKEEMKKLKSQKKSQKRFAKESSKKKKL